MSLTVCTLDGSVLTLVGSCWGCWTQHSGILDNSTSVPPMQTWRESGKSLLLKSVIISFLFLNNHVLRYLNLVLVSHPGLLLSAKPRGHFSARFGEGLTRVHSQKKKASVAFWREFRFNSAAPWHVFSFLRDDGCFFFFFSQQIHYSSNLKYNAGT